MAVFVSPRMTNEEIYLAQKFARMALKTHNVASFSQLVNRELAAPEVVSTASYADLLDAQAIVVVNSDPGEESFVVDLMIRKAVRGGAKLLHIGPEANRSSAAAEVFLRCRDGEQTRALLALLRETARTAPKAVEMNADVEALIEAHAGDSGGVAPEALAEAARILGRSIVRVLVFNKDYRGARRAGDERLFAAAAAAFRSPFLALREKANAQGLLDMGAFAGRLPGYLPVGDAAATERLEKEWCVALPGPEGSGGDIVDLLRQKKIKVAVVLGEDPLGSEPLPKEIIEGLHAADFLIAGDLFATATTGFADVVLPLSSAAETRGTFTNQERRVQRLEQAIPPLAGMDTSRILCDLASRMGYRFKMKYATTDEVTAEIQRAVPIYRSVVVNSAEPDGTWDLGAFPLAAVPPDAKALATVVTPAATLSLDEMEKRFGRWFEKIFADARKAGEEKAEAAAPSQILTT
jgi:predicted molibdopterin-dependent oxidoreductase YjgC